MVDLLRFRAWHKTWEEMGKVKRIRFDDDGNVSTVLFKGKDFGSNTKIDEMDLQNFIYILLTLVWLSGLTWAGVIAFKNRKGK